MGSPSVLMLESPFSDLDQNWREKTAGLLNECIERGLAVIWTSSAPDEMQLLNGRGNLYQRGVKLEQFSREDVLHKEKTFQLRCNDSQENQQELTKSEKIHSIRKSPSGAWRIQLHEADASWLRDKLSDEHASIDSFQSVEQIINSIFLESKEV